MGLLISLCNEELISAPLKLSSLNKINFKFVTVLGKTPVLLTGCLADRILGLQSAVNQRSKKAYDIGPDLVWEEGALSPIFQPSRVVHEYVSGTIWCKLIWCPEVASSGPEYKNPYKNFVSNKPMEHLVTVTRPRFLIPAPKPCTPVGGHLTSLLTKSLNWV